MAIKLKTGTVVTVTTAGTRVQISSQVRAVSSILIQGDESNKGNIYLGDDTVTASNGQAIGPGKGAEISGDQRPSGTEELFINELYLDASKDGDKARISYFIRKP